MLSTTRRLVKARWPRRCRFAMPTQRSRRSSRRTPLRSACSRRMSTMRLFMDLAHRGGVCTPQYRIRTPVIVPSRSMRLARTSRGALNHKPHQSHHRRCPVARSREVTLILTSYVSYPQAHPQSAPSYGQASSGLLQGSVIAPAIDVAQAPVRHTTRIKIESPSVTAAAKKAGSEAVEVNSPDGASSATSDEDTLVSKSKSGKSCSDDVVLSPTKSKL